MRKIVVSKALDVGSTYEVMFWIPDLMVILFFLLF